MGPKRLSPVRVRKRPRVRVWGASRTLPPAVPRRRRPPLPHGTGAGVAAPRLGSGTGRADGVERGARRGHRRAGVGGQRPGAARLRPARPRRPPPRTRLGRRALRPGRGPHDGGLGRGPAPRGGRRRARRGHGRDRGTGLGRRSGRRRGRGPAPRDDQHRRVAAGAPDGRGPRERRGHRHRGEDAGPGRAGRRRLRHSDGRRLRGRALARGGRGGRGGGAFAEPFAGPRSLWGARLARAVHRATREACAGLLAAERTGPAA